ncbi:hypothetical protein Bpfe_026502, partial [Biomphalaria pfeifferi]
MSILIANLSRSYTRPRDLEATRTDLDCHFQGTGREEKIVLRNIRCQASRTFSL